MVGEAFCGGARPLWSWCSSERCDGASVFLALADPRICSARQALPGSRVAADPVFVSGEEGLWRCIAASSVVQGVGSLDPVVRRLPSCRGAVSHPRHQVEQWQRRATGPFWPPAWSGSRGAMCNFLFFSGSFCNEQSFNIIFFFSQKKIWLHELLVQPYMVLRLAAARWSPAP